LTSNILVTGLTGHNLPEVASGAVDFPSGWHAVKMDNGWPLDTGDISKLGTIYNEVCLDLLLSIDLYHFWIIKRLDPLHSPAVKIQ
jgi:hypothetical protein